MNILELIGPNVAPAFRLALTSEELRERASEERQQSIHLIRDEMIDALLHEPASVVSAPKWPSGRALCSEVVQDMLASSQGDELMVELLRITGAVARGYADPQWTLRASALVATIANRVTAGVV